MNATKFLSANHYLYLPTRGNPRVALAVEDAVTARNAMRLYQPFSPKAKILKRTAAIAFDRFNGMAKRIWGIRNEECSEFVVYLEDRLGKPLTISLYFSTIGDKVVMQLQTPAEGIVGYLKYPLNDIGLRHVANEKRAIELLSARGMVKPLLLADHFEGKPFLILSPLEGEIGMVDGSTVEKIIADFRRDGAFKLVEHPRVERLKNELEAVGLSHYLPLVEKIVEDSTAEYGLVYEHGDFTPWNILRTKEGYVPFDFEYFVEDGLEYFDRIKYHYQTGKLLGKLIPETLTAYIAARLDLSETKQIMTLFIIKEIIRNEEEHQPYDFEVAMLEILERM